MFSKTDLTTLIEAAPAIGVSLYLPTRTQGRETRQNPIMLKNLLGQARIQLAARGMTETEIEILLTPAVGLIDDYEFWQHQDHGLALFVTDDGMRSYKLPAVMPELVVVGQGFHITPLLALQENDTSFMILTMTADEAQVWHASQYSMAAAQIANLPASIESLDEEPDYEGSLQSHGFGRPNSGGQNMPKTQVYGDSPEEWRKGRLVEYTRRTIAALAAHLARDPLRIVVVADAEIGGHVLKDKTLAPFIAGFSETNPAALDKGELHSIACAVMQPIHEKAKDNALERFDALIGRGDVMACTDQATLRVAAEEGRVETLFVASGGDGTQSDHNTQTEDASDTELRVYIDRIAQMVLRNGGVIWMVAPERLPDRISIAATLRY